MPNDMWWMGAEWLDVAKIRDQQNQVTEEDVQRAEQQAKQAKQAQQDIKKDKKKNEHFAVFLTFLMKNIKNEKIISYLYNTFFKTRHPKNNILYLRKNINIIVMVGMFVPFFMQEAEKQHITTLFKDFLPSKPITIDKYIVYLKKLAEKFHDNIPLDKENLLNLLIEITITFIDPTQEPKEINQKYSLWLFGK